MRIHDYMKIIEKLPLGKPKLRKKEEPSVQEECDESRDSKNPLETKT